MAWRVYVPREYCQAPIGSRMVCSKSVLFHFPAVNRPSSQIHTHQPIYKTLSATGPLLAGKEKMATGRIKYLAIIFWDWNLMVVSDIPLSKWLPIIFPAASQHPTQWNVWKEYPYRSLRPYFFLMGNYVQQRWYYKIHENEPEQSRVTFSIQVS